MKPGSTHMKKVLSLGVLLLLASLAAIQAFLASYVEFVPMKLRTGKVEALVPAPEVLSAGFQKDLISVLETYSESYRTNRLGKLLIKRSLARDKELIWNYSQKAAGHPLRDQD